MRFALALPLVLLAAACGSATASPPTEPTPWSGHTGPPAAWIETTAGSTWLGFSSYCWNKGHAGVCADAIAPKCGISGVPDVRVKMGETVRAHLGYTPEEASVEGADAQLKGRTVSWKIDRTGPFSLFTKAKSGGDASYVGCAVTS
jgi:hypothetical protein